jgi:hypothetical protein
MAHHDLIVLCIQGYHIQGLRAGTDPYPAALANSVTDYTLMFA